MIRRYLSPVVGVVLAIVAAGAVIGCGPDTTHYIALARIHRRTPMDGERKAEGG